MQFKSVAIESDSDSDVVVLNTKIHQKDRTQTKSYLNTSQEPLEVPRKKKRNSMETPRTEASD